MRRTLRSVPASGREPMVAREAPSSRANRRRAASNACWMPPQGHGGRTGGGAADPSEDRDRLGVENGADAGLQDAVVEDDALGHEPGHRDGRVEPGGVVVVLVEHFDRQAFGVRGGGGEALGVAEIACEDVLDRSEHEGAVGQRLKERRVCGGGKLDAGLDAG